MEFDFFSWQPRFTGEITQIFQQAILTFLQ